MHFASGALSLSPFSFMRHWYVVIFRLEYIAFVSIAVKDEARVLFEKGAQAARVVITEAAS